jgi:hypothetical protein
MKLGWIVATGPEALQRQAIEKLEWIADTYLSVSTLLDVEGGWYATLQVPRVRSEEEWTLDLPSGTGVLVQPGFSYDFESEAYLIVSLLTESGVFRDGVEKLRAFL